MNAQPLHIQSTKLYKSLDLRFITVLRFQPVFKSIGKLLKILCIGSDMKISVKDGPSSPGLTEENLLDQKRSGSLQ